MLNPGLVGLGILDSFTCEIPMVTTDCCLHSPEIAYLTSGTNGVMTDNTLEAYTQACVRLLQQPATLAKLKLGCAQSATEFTIENMASHFADGVLGCLAKPSMTSRGWA